MIAPQIGLENESYGFGGEPSRVSQMDSLQGSRIDAKVKSSPDPSEKNVGTGSSQNEARHVLLNGIPIVSLIIDGQERLCLAQISNTLLKEFSYNEIHNRRVALGITCVQCTPVQLEILRRAGAMPISSRRCGMITKREAERLCKSFLCDNEPPKLPEDFAFDVYHECAWGSRGCFIPSRYNSSRAKCIRCSFCNLFFSPNKFIFHSHRLPVSKYVQPDAANFNSWRRHIKLSDITNEDVNFAWEDVKAMFNGGSRKRTMSSSSSSVSRVGMVAKRPRCDNPSNTSVPVSSAPPAPLQHPLPSHRLVEKTPPYMPIIPFTGKTYPIGGFQPTSTSDLVWNKNSIHPNGTYPHNLSSIIWSANHGSILSSALVQKPTSSWSPYQPHEVPLVDLRSAVGGMYGKMRMGPEFLPSVSYSDVRSAFKPVQRLGGSHKDLEFPSSIRERNEEGGMDIKIDETSSLNRHEYKSDSDIDVNDLSDDNRTPTPPSNAVESIIKSSSVSSIRQPLSPVTTRTEPPEKVDAFESNSNKDGLNQDELTRLCLVNEQNNDIQMHMKLVREKFFYKLEEERATRLAVQQKLKEAHEALHKVSCNSPSCNCKN